MSITKYLVSFLNPRLAGGGLFTNMYNVDISTLSSHPWKSFSFSVHLFFFILKSINILPHLNLLDSCTPFESFANHRIFLHVIPEIFFSIFYHHCLILRLWSVFPHNYSQPFWKNIAVSISVLFKPSCYFLNIPWFQNFKLDLLTTPKSQPWHLLIHPHVSHLLSWHFKPDHFY